MKKGKLVIISGFSGVGKGTVVKELINMFEDCVLSVSATTREPRDGEIDGVHYFFKQRNEFEQLIRENKLLEYAEYVGNYYGTPLDFVNEQREKGVSVILEIEMQGALEVKEKVLDAKLVFILPPSAEELKRRLIGRGTETKEVVEMRLKRAAEETIYIDDYEYHVVNDDIGDCISDLRSIIDDTFENKLDESFINKIKKDISAFSKGDL